MAVQNDLVPYQEFDEKDPRYQVRILSMRVDVLVKEKKELENKERTLENRVEKIERSLGKGAGILIGLSVVGTLGGIIAAWGRTIFGPWMK